MDECQNGTVSVELERKNMLIKHDQIYIGLISVACFLHYRI